MPRPQLHGRDHLPGKADPIPGLFGDVALNAIIDGVGSPLVAGVAGDVQLARSFTIVAWTMLADVPGSAVVDIWKDVYAGFPPTDADSITASAPPTLAGDDAAHDEALTGWTTDIAAGDVLRFNVDSASTITQLTLALTLRPR